MEKVSRFDRKTVRGCKSQRGFKVNDWGGQAVMNSLPGSIGFRR